MSKNKTTTSPLVNTILKKARSLQEQLSDLAFNVNANSLRLEEQLELSIYFGGMMQCIGVMTGSCDIDPKGANIFLKDIKEQQEQKKRVIAMNDDPSN